jgi:hypothetical protein
MFRECILKMKPFLWAENLFHWDLENMIKKLRKVILGLKGFALNAYSNGKRILLS